MTPADLTAWMARLGLNKSNAAKALGIGRPRLDRYLAGKVEIPHVVRLACRMLEEIEKINRDLRLVTGGA
jgi:predicted XRE-type DNA-binding protein